MKQQACLSTPTTRRDRIIPGASVIAQLHASNECGPSVTKATIALARNDFQGLLAESHGYSEEGLTGRIHDRIVTTFTRQIDEQLSETLLKSVVTVYLARNITARQILERGHLALSRLELTVDLKRGAHFEGFVGAPPLLEAGVAPQLIDEYCIRKRELQGNANNLKH
jgi:hypothetical protein